RVESRSATILEGEADAAGKRADERNWTHAGPPGVCIERERTGERAITGKQLGRIDADEAQARARGEPIGPAQKRQLGGQPTAGNAAFDSLQRQLLGPEMDHAGDIARGE